MTEEAGYIKKKLRTVYKLMELPFLSKDCLLSDLVRAEISALTLQRNIHLADWWLSFFILHFVKCTLCITSKTPRL